MVTLISLTRTTLCLIISVLGLAGCVRAHQLDIRQEFVGTNGPSQVGVLSIANSAELENSWVRKSLSDDELREIQRGVDFEKYFLVAFAAGDVDSYSGSIHVSRVYEYAGVRDLPINVEVKVGVLGRECVQRLSSRPFVLARVERSSNAQPAIAFNVQVVVQPCPFLTMLELESFKMPDCRT